MEGNLGQAVGNNGLNPMLQVKNGIMNEVKAKIQSTSGTAHIMLQMKPAGQGFMKSNDVTGIVTDSASVEGISTIGGKNKGTGVFTTPQNGNVSTITQLDIYGTVHLSIHGKGKFSAENAKYVDGLSEAVSSLGLDQASLADSLVIVAYAGIGNAWQSKDRKNWVRDNYKEDELIRKFSPGLNDKIVKENSYHFSSFKHQTDAFFDFLVSYGGVIGKTNILRFSVPSVARRFNAGGGIIAILPAVASSDVNLARIAPIVNSWLAQPAEPYLKFVEGQVDVESVYSNL